MSTLAGKVAFITGAGTGIGAATALLLARQGAKLSLIGRRVAQLIDVQNAIIGEGGQARAIEADVADATAMNDAVDETVKAFAACILRSTMPVFPAAPSLWARSVVMPGAMSCR